METRQHRDKSAKSSAPRCPQCDSVVETNQKEHVFRYGRGQSLVEINVRLPVHRCEPCDFEFLDHEGERLKHEALCEHFGVLTPREVRHIRKRHGMTRAEFANVSGLGEASLGRWENGTVIQNHANDRYLRLLAQPNGIAQLSAVLASKSPARCEHTTKDCEILPKRFKILSITDDMKKKKLAFHLRKKKAA